jgi:DNA-binding response OmpR family regulator
VPKTLLAVDDSVTMRKIIEMTFAGEDMRVVSVATADEALAAARKEKPDLVLTDVSLDGTSGYDLCKKFKDEFGTVPVIILASPKQNPYDAAKGQAAGADDHLDKPYDTTKTIELVKAVLTKGKSMAPGAMAVPVAAPTTPKVAAVASSPAPAAKAAAMPARLSTPAAPQAEPVRPAPTPAAVEVQHGTLAELAQVPQVSHAARPAAAASADFSAKLQGLGLSAAQIEAVLALSREVVERVVWEVVPVLAETMVKEELARLMKE